MPLSVPPPDPPPVDWDERVDISTDDLRKVLRELPRRLDRKRHYGFNHDGKGHAWLVAERGVPLRKLVEEILGAPT